MRTTSLRIAPVGTLACALPWLLATAATAAAGTYTVNAYVAERFGLSTQAFGDFPALGIPMGGMFMRRNCARHRGRGDRPTRLELPDEADQGVQDHDREHHRAVLDLANANATAAEPSSAYVSGP